MSNHEPETEDTAQSARRARPIPEVSKRSLVVNLFAEAGGACTVRSFEVTVEGCRNRTAFIGRPSPDDVFDPAFVSEIKLAVEALGPSGRAAFLPDQGGSANGASYLGVHTMKNDAGEGAFSVMITFRNFEGHVEDLLKTDFGLGLSRPVNHEKERVTAETLRDVVLPLLNVITELEHSANTTSADKIRLEQSRVADTISQLASRANLIRFKAFQLQQALSKRSTPITGERLRTIG